jgi:hypothetical protein
MGKWEVSVGLGLSTAVWKERFSQVKAGRRLGVDRRKLGDGCAGRGGTEVVLRVVGCILFSGGLHRHKRRWWRSEKAEVVLYFGILGGSWCRDGKGTEVKEKMHVFYKERKFAAERGQRDI